MTEMPRRQSKESPEGTVSEARDGELQEGKNSWEKMELCRLLYGFDKCGMLYLEPLE